MKEQGKNSQDQINEEEIDKLSEKEFRIKMIQNLKNRLEKMQESNNIFNFIFFQPLSLFFSFQTSKYSFNKESYPNLPQSQMA